MYKHYYINNNQTSNPGLHHEVHTKEHATQLGIRSTQYDCRLLRKRAVSMG